MKVLFVVSGTKRVAATRYRVYQYLPYLEEAHIKYSVFSITSDFVTKLAIRSPEFNELKRFFYYMLLFVEKFLRFWVVFLRTAYFDIIFLQRATFPFGLGNLIGLLNRRIIFDIDDAIFLPDTAKQNMLTRFKAFIKERELKDILKISQVVLVENEYIEKYVSKHCKNIYKIPGPIDTERYFVKEKKNLYDKGIVLGWIGSPATTAYLHLLDNVFSKILSRLKNIKVVLMGVGNYNFASKRVINKTWSYEEEVGELQAFDIGLMPMPDDEWTRGKLGCKMLQYMAVGIPSVVSFTPTNAELIKDGENGFLVRNESEWLERLTLLIEDAGLREKIGKAGRHTVEELCSVKKNAPQLIEILRGIN